MTQFDVKSYTTRSAVPYKRDEEQPHFAGAQGTVFKATRTVSLTALRRKVDAFAVKEIVLGSHQARSRLQKEIKHLQLCQHPNVLQLKEAYRIEQLRWADRIFLVTSPWAQSSLQRLLEAVATSDDGTCSECPWYNPDSLGPWPDIVRQCVLGLEHLHNNKIRHKDLKPDNILLVNDSPGDSAAPSIRPIIADLGISKGYIEAENTTFNGTYQYLAPEQKDKSSSTYKSDIFCLGCCIAWIHALLSTNHWELSEKSERGVNQLDELVATGFADNSMKVLPFLEQMRQDYYNGRLVEVGEFLITAESIIAPALLQEPNERPTLKTIVTRLDAFERSCPKSKIYKLLALSVTSRQQSRYFLLELKSSSFSLDWFNRSIGIIIIRFSPKIIPKILRRPGFALRNPVLAICYEIQTRVDGPCHSPIMSSCIKKNITSEKLDTKFISTLVIDPLWHGIRDHHGDGSHTCSVVLESRQATLIFRRFHLAALVLGIFMFSLILFWSGAVRMLTMTLDIQRYTSPLW